MKKVRRLLSSAHLFYTFKYHTPRSNYPILHSHTDLTQRQATGVPLTEF